VPELDVLRGADHLGGLALAVRDAPELVVPGGLELRRAKEIWIVERRAVHWLWDVRAREGSHARRAVGDSNLVWEQISPKKLDASSRPDVLRPLGKWQAGRMR